MTDRPNAQELLESFLGGGWKGFDKIDEINKAASAAQQQHQSNLARTYYRVFSSPEGAEVLDDLVAITLRRATWDGNRGLLDAVSYGFMREGQNQIVARILQLMAAAIADEKGVTENVSTEPEQATRGGRRRR